MILILTSAAAVVGFIFGIAATLVALALAVRVMS